MASRYLSAFFLAGKKLNKSSNKGFTLVELLTAVGVFTILASIVLVTVNPLEQFRKAQDSKRKSDLAQTQRALESYYQDFGKYPAYTTTGQNTYTINIGSGEDANAVKWGDTWSPYMDIVPVDPNSSKFYLYWSDSSNNYQSYRLYASLDRGSNDPDACVGTSGCSGAPGGCGIDASYVCNFGVTSPNISP